VWYGQNKWHKKTEFLSAISGSLPRCFINEPVPEETPSIGVRESTFHVGLRRSTKFCSNVAALLKTNRVALAIESVVFFEAAPQYLTPTGLVYCHSERRYDISTCKPVATKEGR
jgi:hypothetical protein